MQKYKIIVSPSAKAHIKAITAYIQDKLLAPQAAKSIALDIKKSIASLRTLPERIPEVFNKPGKVSGLRRMVVKNYLVYFQIDEAARQVIVHAVIYGKRDQAAQMEQLSKYTIQNPKRRQ